MPATTLHANSQSEFSMLLEEAEPETPSLASKGGDRREKEDKLHGGDANLKTEREK